MDIRVVVPTARSKRVSSVVQDYIDGAGTLGWVPSDNPAGIHYGRADLNQGDETWIESVSVAGVKIRLEEGGAYRIRKEPGVASGTHSFVWRSTGAAPNWGIKEFIIP